MPVIGLSAAEHFNELIRIRIGMISDREMFLVKERRIVIKDT
jgi:hypothetical protein